MGTAAEVGAIIRRARQSAGMTQEELGRLCDYSAATVSRMERGRQQSLRDIEVLRRVALALSIPLWQVGLAPNRSDESGHNGGRLAPRVVPIREGGGWVDRRTMLAASLAALGAAPLAAILPGDAPADPAAGLAAELGDRLLGWPKPTASASVQQVHRTLTRVREDYAAANYQQLARALPHAITAAEACADATAGSDAAAAATMLLARTYNSVSDVAIKLGRLDLAWVATDRAMLAARRSGDVLALAESAREVAFLLRKAGQPDHAMSIAVEAADRLDDHGLGASADHLATYGLLLSTAGYAAAQAGDAARADELLAAAAAAATRVDASDLAMFSPTSVAIYRVGASWTLGDPATAIAHARTVSVAAIPTAERRERYWVDVARAWQRWGKPVECFRALLRAERVAPQAVRVRPVVHSVTNWLLSAPSTVGMAGLREFAIRVAGT